MRSTSCSRWKTSWRPNEQRPQIREAASAVVTSSRLPLPDLARLSAEQQAVADKVAAGPRGQVRGPVRLWLHSPELAARAQELGEFLRWRTSLDPRISELVILATARHYTCHYIWFNHVGLALDNGVSQQAIDDMKHGRPPRWLQDDEATAHQLAIEILRDNAPDDETLDRARRAFGDRGVVEVGALIAHYHSGAIVLSLSDVTLPDGTRECLP